MQLAIAELKPEVEEGLRILNNEVSKKRDRVYAQMSQLRAEQKQAIEANRSNRSFWKKLFELQGAPVQYSPECLGVMKRVHAQLQTLEVELS